VFETVLTSAGGHETLLGMAERAGAIGDAVEE
jgi:hypothetical protein